MKSITNQYPMYFGANPDIFKKAKELRKYETSTEKIIWSKICNNQILGFSFRRQHPINQFIADFYCPKLKLVIEIDGNIHDKEKNKEYDIERSKIIREFGITILRFSNEQVISDINNVIKTIKNTTETLTTELPSPPNGGFRG